mgnify:CR=1 FL=1|tara:strand:- start:207 stop:689 length:483 start_codon:yes stop_codon:yes gene_type:complete
MMSRRIIILLVLIPITFLTSCGFKKINLNNGDSIHIQSINITGERRVGTIIKNDILLISNADSNDKYNIDVKIIKKKANKIKDDTGKVIRHTLSITADFKMESANNSRESIYRSITRSSDYDVAKNHADTINNENNVYKNIVQQISDDLVGIINLTIKIK